MRSIETFFLFNRVSKVSFSPSALSGLKRFLLIIFDFTPGQLLDSYAGRSIWVTHGIGATLIWQSANKVRMGHTQATIARIDI